MRRMKTVVGIYKEKSMFLKLACWFCGAKFGKLRYSGASTLSGRKASRFIFMVTMPLTELIPSHKSEGQLHYMFWFESAVIYGLISQKEGSKVGLFYFILDEGLSFF